MKNKFVLPVALTIAALSLAACSGGGGRYYRDYPTDRYVSSQEFEGNPYAFDSDIYYDPHAGYRGGWVYPRYRVRPY